MSRDGAHIELVTQAFFKGYTHPGYTINIGCLI